MLITKIIADYLTTNRRITVGGLGSFLTKQGGGEIIFSEFVKDDDGVLRSLLIANGLKELEAMAIVDRFVFDLRYALTTEGRASFDLPRLGRMTLCDGALTFEYDPSVAEKVEPQPIIKVAEAQPEVESTPTQTPTQAPIQTPTPTTPPAAEPVAAAPIQTQTPIQTPVTAAQTAIEEPIVSDSNLFDSFANYAGEGQNLDVKKSIYKWWFIFPIIAILFIVVALFYWLAVEWMYGNIELPAFLDSLFGSIFMNEGAVPPPNPEL